jgi:hypothetical protein
MGTVDSDVVKAIGFSGRTGEKGTLRVKLSDGTVVDYTGVEYELYRRFVLSNSQGQFFNEHIRGKF